MREPPYYCAMLREVACACPCNYILADADPGLDAHTASFCVLRRCNKDAYVEHEQELDEETRTLLRASLPWAVLANPLRYAMHDHVKPMLYCIVLCTSIVVVG